MSYWILTDAGCLISRTTVQRVTDLELTTDEVKQQCKEYNQRVHDVLQDFNHIFPQSKQEHSVTGLERFSSGSGPRLYQRVSARSLT
jgi:hypothetical protein